MKPRAEDPLAQAAPRLAALAEAEPELEACGLVVASPEGGEVEPWPLPNRADDARRTFALGPAELLAALRRLDAEGRVLLAVYHSHPAGGAELSQRDLEGALVDGTPLLRGVAQVVVALDRGRAMLIRVHRWHVDRFVAADLWTPQRGAAPRGAP